MLNINVNGKQINLKTIALWAAVISGGYTLGANYPQLNPNQLLNLSNPCEVSNG
jgi:hypothetical protein